VIHDTMDFRHPLDAESHRRLRVELRAKYQIGASDIVLFVGARIAPNKQIEFAARLTAALEALRHKLAGKRLYSGEVFQLESRIVLVLAGRPERAFADYQAGLWSLMDDLGLNWVYAGDSVSPLRVPGQGYYALYPDMYSIADFVLYPSSWEGFGNQLLEAFAVGLPVVVFEYPVYKEDIAPKGVKVISLGDAVAKISETALSDAADQMIPLLTDTAAREQVTSHNREIGKRHFDFEVLRAHLAESIRWAAERGLQRPVSPQKRNR
ncbi:MAG: glycosyltransferase family 4 protein, partial [bacterium]|nr:glycosyltransferase family 4 protein [bacterium]